MTHFFKAWAGRRRGRGKLTVITFGFIGPRKLIGLRLARTE